MLLLILSFVHSVSGNGDALQRNAGALGVTGIGYVVPPANKRPDLAAMQPLSGVKIRPLTVLGDARSNESLLSVKMFCLFPNTCY